MSALDLLARRCLVSWYYRMVVRNTLSAVFNGNRNISCWRTSKFNRLWCISLTLRKYPTSWNLSVSGNGLIRLARYSKATTINGMTSLVNIGNVHGLIISRVVNVDRLVCPVSDLCLAWS